MAGGCGAWPRQDIATIAITPAITALVLNVTFIGPPQLVKLHGPEEGYERGILMGNPSPRVTENKGFTPVEIT